MAEPFKNLISAELVRTAARHLRRVSPGFPQQRFVHLASRGLEALELKQRVLHVTKALVATLPQDFAAAADVLEQSLAPASDDVDWSRNDPGDGGLAGWVIWPLAEFVAQRGLGSPRRALQALHALTQRLTAEYAIRPFLLAHEELTFATLRQWVKDPSAHVRRLVSEGTRPRLPWGMRLQRLVADPSPSLPLLEALQDDLSEYVRRSVANHLNDIAKDHPDLVASWLERHLPGAPPERRSLLRHASRTLIKKGHRRALAAWGVDRGLRGRASLAVTPKSPRIGDNVVLAVTLASAAASAQRLVVDYVVHRARPDGSTRPKVWKGWTLELGPREQRTLQKRHSLKPVSVRRDHPGRHAVDLVVNGRVVASAAFTLKA